MLFAFIGALIFGAAMEFQNKYDHCKSIAYKGEYCKMQKKLSEYEK